MKYSIIQSTGGNKYVQMKNERELHKLVTESLLNNSNESGGNKKSSLYSRLFFTAVVEKEKQILKISLPHGNFSYFRKPYILPKNIKSSEGLSTQQKTYET